jgi:hypothetical protein
MKLTFLSKLITMEETRSALELPPALNLLMKKSLNFRVPLLMATMEGKLPQELQLTLKKKPLTSLPPLLMATMEGKLPQEPLV